MEKMGTPNMILEELKIAKQEIETLKSKIEAKEKSLVNYRADTTKLRTENFDLKRQMVALKKRQEEEENTGTVKANDSGDTGAVPKTNHPSRPPSSRSHHGSHSRPSSTRQVTNS